MSDMNQCINLNMTLGAQYDINIQKEEIYTGPYVDLLNGTIETLDDTIIPSNVVHLRDYLFYGNTTLTSVFLHNIISIGSSVFNGAALNQIDLPNLETAGQAAFSNNQMDSINLPNLINISVQLFQGCSELIIADFSSIESIGAYAFYGCTNLDTLFLRNENVIPDLSSSAFIGTKIESKEGYIYVPESILREFRLYSGWSAYASQILPIIDEDENS